MRQSPNPLLRQSISMAYLIQSSSGQTIFLNGEEVDLFVQLHNDARRTTALPDRNGFAAPFTLCLQTTTQQLYLISPCAGTRYIRVAPSRPPHSPPSFRGRSRKYHTYYLDSQALYDFLQSLAAQQDRWESPLSMIRYKKTDGRRNPPAVRLSVWFIRPFALQPLLHPDLRPACGTRACRPPSKPPRDRQRRCVRPESLR